VEVLVFSAARRLAFLVAAALAFVAVPFVRDAHVRTVPAFSGGLAVALLAVALVHLLRASRLLKDAQAAAKTPAAARVYRANARAQDDDPLEQEATHQAAVALFLLAFAASLTVVSAAAR
jgi:hypothetical protein